MATISYIQPKTAYIKCELEDLDEYIYERKSRFGIDNADDLELFCDKHFEYDYDATMVASVDYFEILDMYDSITLQNTTLTGIKPRTALGEEIIIDTLNHYFDELL
jgi:hypothetical protein